MDGTHPNRISNTTAVATTRKRRSSILKSQKQPRTPFSELEFNVATPTDTTKSRRVSFSRRTGVAEFVTNEATTTWKTFYEEHNKTAESSGNDSSNVSRQPLGHIGQRIFDQQFQDLEIDLVSTNVDPTTLNDVNFSQQIVALECTEDKKISFPQTNFELSSLTDHHTKLFGDDVTNPTMGEMSGHIDINFSAVQPIVDGKDDLDEIQKELDLVQTIGVCQGSFSARDMSQYIEVDLLMTHVPKNDESDMSITDTIHSPKVQDVSKNQIDQKPPANKDWVADKENIAVHPYMAPPETKKIAINEECDEVLVFDGKRLTVQSNKDDLPSLDHTKHTSLRQKPQRKTIVLDVDDDLPNFVSNPDTLPEHKHIMTVCEDSNLSITQPVQGVDALSDRRKTIVYANSDGNISITQALSAKIVLPKGEILPEKIKTVFYENNTGDISIETALPTNIVFTEKSGLNVEKRRTIVFQNDNADISMTTAVPSNILPNKITAEPDKGKTILYESDEGNISMTRPLPGNIVQQKSESKTSRRNTVFFENDNNISLTQALPSNVILPNEAVDKRKSVLYGDDFGNISITQALPTNIVVSENENNNDISETQALPSNVILPNKAFDKRKSVLYGDDFGNISITQALPTNIVVSENENNNDISETQALPSNVILPNKAFDKRKSVLYGDDFGNISITQALPTNIVLSENENNNDISIMQALPCNEILPNEAVEKLKSVLYGDDLENISITQALSINKQISRQFSQKAEAKSDKRRTIIFETDNEDISMTQALPANIVISDKSEVKSDITGKIVLKKITGNLSVTRALPTDIILPSEPKSVAKIVNALGTLEDNMGNSSVKQSVSSNIIFPNKSDIIFEDNKGNISINQAVPANILIPDKVEKRKTVVPGNSLWNIYVAQNLSSSSILNNTERNEDVSMTEITNEYVNINDKSLTQAITSNIIGSLQQELVNRRTIVFNDTRDLSKPIPAALNSIKKEINESKKVHNETTRETFSDTRNVIVYQAVTDQSSKHQLKGIEQGDSKSEDIVNSNLYKIDSSGLKTKAFNTDDHNESIEEVVDNYELNQYNEEKAETNRSLQIVETSEPCVNKPKKSILNDLLDMSNASLVIEDNIVRDSSKFKNGTELSPSDSVKSEKLKSPTSVISRQVQSLQERVSHTEQSTSPQAVSSSEPLISIETGNHSTWASEESTDTNTQNSSEVMFRILKDSDEQICNYNGKELDSSPTIDIQPKEGRKSLRFSNKIELRSPLPVEYKQSSGLVEELQTKLEIIKKISGNNNSSHRCDEKLVSSEEEVNNTNYKDNLDVSQGNANGVLDETKKLIEMLTKQIDEDEDESVSPVTVKGHIAIENKSEVKTRSVGIPVRLSFINQEELLKNSTTQAVLSKSRCESSNFEMMESPTLEREEHSFCINNDVIKTLHFDEESFSDSSIKASPLKKTPVGKTSYITEPKKANVIPTFMKDVSDGIKELMQELVKPTADVLPYDGRLNQLKKNVSKCSTQIQANLNTSSQVELDLDTMKASSSLVTGISNLANKAITHALKSPTKSILVSSSDKFSLKTTEPMNVSPTSHEEMRFRPRRHPIKLPSPEPVIVFDRFNPLNNVLLNPINLFEAHRYNPMKSDETLVSERSQSMQYSPKEQSIQNLAKESLTEYPIEETRNSTKEGDVGRRRASVQYNVGHVDLQYHQSGDVNLESGDSKTSNLSKPASIDESIDVRVSELRDTEVNTLIAMRENKELLDASSSLTLVDEAPNRQFHVDIQDTNEKNNVSAAKDSSLTTIVKGSLNDGSPVRNKSGKAQKRNYSPFKRAGYRERNRFSLDETPKNSIKQQKMSHSPNVKTFDVLRVSPEKLCAEKDDEDLVKSENDLPAQKSAEKRGKSESNMTVQQLLTEFNKQADINQEAMEKQVLETLSHSSSAAYAPDMKDNLEKGISFTSSKNQDKLGALHSASSNECSTESSGPWLPEVNIDTSNVVLECDSSMNVIAKIDMLPIMGRDCEWELSTHDAWSFRLLCARLRLRVRLAHRHSNALRTYVRADTPLTEIAVETVHYDKKNPIGATCVRLASEAMRYVCVRVTDARASVVPALLRRCAAISRAAMQWARAMHDARVRLAYTLNEDGFVTLKVANIPLRSVWEVRFRIEMVLEGALSTPWPRANHVQVIPVVAGAEACEAGVRRAMNSVPADWGHVPRTVWKVFKYLKHKKPNDEELLGL